ncbi:MAG: PilZ domain-containing protein [Myxococcaceae bacterium]|nr:PilZ domain-containing protein [Myxococcaceae bacterium]
MNSVEFFVNKRPGYTQARSHLRVPASFPVRVVNATSLRLADEARDVSEAGVGVLTHSPLPPMTLVPLRLELPTSSEPIEVLGRVMWSTTSAMGLRFEQPDERLHSGVARLRAALDRL